MTHPLGGARGERARPRGCVAWPNSVPVSTPLVLSAAHPTELLVMMAMNCQKCNGLTLYSCNSKKSAECKASEFVTPFKECVRCQIITCSNTGGMVDAAHVRLCAFPRVWRVRLV